MLSALNWFLDIKKSHFLIYLSRVDNNSAFLFSWFWILNPMLSEKTRQGPQFTPRLQKEPNIRY